MSEPVDPGQGTEEAEGTEETKTESTTLRLNSDDVDRLLRLGRTILDHTGEKTSLTAIVTLALRYAEADLSSWQRFLQDVGGIPQ